jgi:hypothetical protein
MNKISTRKGLGLGAVFALATTLFAGAPAAQAAVAPVTLADALGHGTYTVPFGTSFDLKSFVTNSALGGTQGDGVDTGNWIDPSNHDLGYKTYGLKYNVKNVSANDNYSVLNVGVGSHNYDDTYSDGGYSDPNGYALSKGQDYTFDAYDYGYSTTDNDFAVAATNNNNNTPVKLQITAFVDSNGDYIADANEESATVTITYVDPQSLTTSIKIADTYAGDSEIDANVTFANKDVNVEQIQESIWSGWGVSGYYGENYASELGVSWTRNNTDYALSGYDNVGGWSNDQNYVYYDSDANALVFAWDDNINGGNDDVATGLYTAQLYDYNYGWEKMGTKAQATIGTDPVDHVGAIKSANSANEISTGGNDFLVRSGTKSVTYTTTVYKADSDGKTDNNPVGAGITGKFYVYDDGLEYGSSITAGGKTLLPGDSAISIPVTTDANGQISLTITGTAVDSDEIYVWANVHGEDSNDDAYDSYTEWRDTDYNFYGVNGDDKAIAVGGTATFSYRVEDQWNQPATTGFQVHVYRSTGASRDTNASWEQYVPVANGVATVTIKDNGAGYGWDYIYADLQKKNTGEGYHDYEEASWGNYLTYTDSALITPNKVTASVNNNGVKVGDTAVSPLKLSDLSKFVAESENRWNSLNGFTFGANRYATTTADASGTLEVYGTVSNDLVNSENVPVTISLPGAVFRTEVNNGDENAYNNYDEYTAKDSITVYTDSNGGYYAEIWSDVPGKQTITVTAGSASKTVDVTFAQSTPKSVALSVAGGAATAQAGRSAAVAATVKDAGGHPVSGVTVTFAAAGGTGSLSASTATTNASGVATVNYVTGVSDVGSVDFTATAPSGSDTLTSSKVTVSFVHSTGNVTHKKAVVTANWANAKGQSILVTVDGYRRYNQVELADGANFFSKKLKKGRHTVNLYVGGVLVDSLKFTVKK